MRGKIIFAALTLLCLSGLPAWAASPYGDPPADGATNQHWANYSYIMAGTPFSHSGVVTSVDYYGGGLMTLQTGQDQVLVCGAGPVWYWEQQEMSWPQVGEVLQVEGYQVNLNGVATNIIMAVTTGDGKRLELRNPDTGWPLWMGSVHHGGY